MDFAFSWEFPAAMIGAASVLIAAGAGVFAVARSSHGPSHIELVVLGFLAVIGIWSWDTRIALAKRFFPDGTGVMEEEVALSIRNYSDCSAFVAKAGTGDDDGAICTIDVRSSRGRYVAAQQPPALQESPCDILAVPELRKWTFITGSVHDWCE
jgi:hypothetical protein